MAERTLWYDHERIRARRARSTAVDLAIETLDGWRRHVTGRNVAVLTYFGFLSIFPLFMVATTVLAIVLRGNERLQQEILDTAVAQIPVIGTQIQNQAGELDGNYVTLTVGLAIALWAATRAFFGVQIAFDDTWEIPVDARDGLATRRLKALAGILVIGGGLIAATAVSAIATATALPATGRVLLVLGTLTINVAVLGSMMRLLTAAEVTWSMAWPGALLGGTAFTVLQFVGATVVTRVLSSASDTSGVFATVFALLAWLNLHAMFSLVGGELNAARVRRRLGLPATDVVDQMRARPSASQQSDPLD